MTTTGNKSEGAQLQDWVSFLSVLNSNRQTAKSLLQKAQSPDKMIRHLERALKVQAN